MGVKAAEPPVSLDDVTTTGDLLPPFESRMFLISGPPGAGKTSSLRTLPQVDKEGKTNNTLLLSFDGKYSVLSGEKTITIVNLYTDPSAENYFDISMKVEGVLKKLREKEWIFPFIVIDPLGLVQKVYEKRSHDEFPKGGWDRVNYLKDSIWHLLSGCVKTGSKVILISHEASEKTEMGMIQFSHTAFGSLVEDLPVQFHEVWRAYVSGEGEGRSWRWQTGAQGLYPKCASRIPGLPLTIEQDFSKVLTTKWWLLKGVEKK